MKDLTLTPVPPVESGTPSGGGCGCSCGCGSSSAADVPAPVSVGGVVTYPVAGLTCGGCVSRVTRAVERLSGVTGVRVDLVRGGVSTVSVTGGVPPEDVRRVLAAAGYPVTE